MAGNNAKLMAHMVTVHEPDIVPSSRLLRNMTDMHVLMYSCQVHVSLYWTKVGIFKNSFSHSLDTVKN